MDVFRAEGVITAKNEASAVLKRVEADYQATMAHIARMRAEAELGVKTASLDRDLEIAKQKVRKFNGERARFEIGSHGWAKAQAELEEARREVKRLDGQKATLELKTQGEQKVLANLEKINRARLAQAKAEEKLFKEKEKWSRDIEKQAYRENELRNKAELDDLRRQGRIIDMQKQYAKLTDEVEKAVKAQKGSIGEVKAKAVLDESRARIQMKILKKELEIAGGHPPVKIGVDTDGPLLKRTRLKIINGVKDIIDKVSSMGNARVNIGPISGSLRGVVVAGSLLAPIITSLIGSAGALVGVLGTGLAGAAATAAGTMGGLAINMIGVKTAIAPMISDVKTAMSLQKAYNLAVLKYGADSKQAIKAHDAYRSAMAQIDPVARKAVNSFGEVSKAWKALTQNRAQRSLDTGLTQGVKTLKAIMPTVAQGTNQSFGIITNHITRIAKALRSAQGIHILGSLQQSGNNFLDHALRAAEHLGVAFAHVAESAARLFSGPAGHGLEKWAAHIDAATKPGKHLDDQIRRLGNHATDLLHLFAAFGRLMVTVFNGGANSGDTMVKSLTRVLNHWNNGLKTGKGHRDMLAFFDRSIQNTMKLAGVLGPLIGAFAQWSSMLAPITTGILAGVGAVAKFTAHILSLVTTISGSKGTLAVFGATIGVVFGVSKLARFASFVGRIISMLKTASGLALAGKFGEAFKTIAAGPKGALTGAKEAGVTIASSMEAAGRRVAAWISEAMGAGGKVASSEIAAGEAAGGKVAGAEIATSEAAGGAGVVGGGGKRGGASGGFLMRGGLALLAAHEIATRGFHNSDLDPLAALGIFPDHTSPNDVTPSTKASGRTLAQWMFGNTSRARDLAPRNFDFAFRLSDQMRGLGVQGLGSGAAKIAKSQIDATLAAIGSSITGRKFLVNLAIRTNGDVQARRAIAQLASSRLGSKLLTIISQGGPQAAKWLSGISKTPIGRKILDIIQRGGPAAQRLVAELQNKKLRDKVLRIIEHGGPNAVRLLEKLLHVKIPEKHFHVKSTIKDGISASAKAITNALKSVPKAITSILRAKAPGMSVIDQVKSALGNIPRTITSTINVIKHAFGMATGGVALPMFAEGGKDELAAKQARAAEIAMQRGPDTKKFGRFNRPTLLVGEENRTEYVIATNPSYRRQNIAYLQEAAGALGAQVIVPGATTMRRAYTLPGQGGVIMAAKGRRPGTPPPFGGPEALHAHQFATGHYGTTFIGLPGPMSMLQPGPGYHDPYSVGAIDPEMVKNALQSLKDAIAAQQARHDLLKLVTHPLRDKNNILFMDNSTQEGRDPYSFHYWRVRSANRHLSPGLRRVAARQAEYWKVRGNEDRAELKLTIAGGRWPGSKANKANKPTMYYPMKELKAYLAEAQGSATRLYNWLGDPNDLKTHPGQRQLLLDQAGQALAEARQDETDFAKKGEQKYMDDWKVKMALHDRLFAQVMAKDKDASALAQQIFTKFNTQQLKDYAIKMRGNVTADEGEVTIDTETKPTFTGKQGPSLEQYLGSLGPLAIGGSIPTQYVTAAAEEHSLEANLALARANNISNNPTTFADDVQAAQQRLDFYSGALAHIKADPVASQYSDLIKEAADMVSGARSDLESAQGGSSPQGVGVSPAYILDTKRQDVLSQYASNTAGIDTLNPFSDPVSMARGGGGMYGGFGGGAGAAMGLGGLFTGGGVLGGGGGSFAPYTEINPSMLGASYGHSGSFSGMSTAGAGNRPTTVHVNNTFGAPPPDPHTWSQGVKFELNSVI